MMDTLHPWLPLSKFPADARAPSPRLCQPRKHQPQQPRGDQAGRGNRPRERTKLLQHCLLGDCDGCWRNLKLTPLDVFHHSLPSSCSHWHPRVSAGRGLGVVWDGIALPEARVAWWKAQSHEGSLDSRSSHSFTQTAGGLYSTVQGCRVEGPLASAFLSQSDQGRLKRKVQRHRRFLPLPDALQRPACLRQQSRQTRCQGQGQLYESPDGRIEVESQPDACGEGGGRHAICQLQPCGGTQARDAVSQRAGWRGW